jgi:hypothetical protein
MRTIHIVHVEGNTDYWSDSLAAFPTLEEAEKWKREIEDEELKAGELVEGREDEWPDDYRQESVNADWTRSFSIREVVFYE